MKHMKWDIPGYQYNNPNQIIFWSDALKFCATPLKFDTKVAHFDISVLSLPHLVTMIQQCKRNQKSKEIWMVYVLRSRYADMSQISNGAGPRFSC